MQSRNGGTIKPAAAPKPAPKPVVAARKPAKEEELLLDPEGEETLQEIQQCAQATCRQQYADEPERE